jgi:hypothetical protein
MMKNKFKMKIFDDLRVPIGTVKGSLDDIEDCIKKLKKKYR